MLVTDAGCLPSGRGAPTEGLRLLVARLIGECSESPVGGEVEWDIAYDAATGRGDAASCRDILHSGMEMRQRRRAVRGSD